MICPYCLKEMRSGWLLSYRGRMMFSEKKKHWFWNSASKDDIHLSDKQFGWLCPDCEKIVIDVKGKNRRGFGRTLTDTDVRERNITVGEWTYRMPDFSRDPNGLIILIDRYTLDGTEAFDWGLDADNEPFTRHRTADDFWWEDDVDLSYITMEELTEEIERLSDFFAENGYLDWAGAYQNVLVWLQSDSGGSSLQIPNS